MCLSKDYVSLKDRLLVPIYIKYGISAGYNVFDNLVLVDLRYVPRNQHFFNAGLNNIKSLIIYE